MDDAGGVVPYRWRAVAPWLGSATEAFLIADRLILRDADAGAVATLDMSEVVDVVGGFTGVRLRVRRRGCWVDFGGVMIDGWYDIVCPDVGERADFVAALTHALANVGGEHLLPMPFLARIRHPRSRRS